MDSPSATIETDLPHQGEEVEAALADLAERVDAAQQALCAALDAEPERIWSMRELQDAAANGHSSSVMSIAFLRLLHAGKLHVDKDQRVHAA